MNLDYKPGKQAFKRCAKASLQLMVAVPAFFFGRTERVVEPLLTLAVLMGGVAAWLQPKIGETFVEYSVRPTIAQGGAA